MDKTELKSLVDLKLSTYSIAKELNCSQTNVRYWLKKHKLTTSIENKINCVTCGNKLQGNQRKFCSRECNDKTKVGNIYTKQIERYTQRKMYLLDLRGGGCEKCGYNKCMAALDFHHNKGVKNFSLDSRTLSNISMDRIIEEFELCEVLCANCHREEHYCNSVVLQGVEP